MKYNKLLWKMKVNQLLIRLGLREPDPIWYIGGSDVLPQPLPRAKEREVLEAMKNGDLGAKSTLIEHNLRLVVYIARRFENTGHQHRGLDLHRYHRADQGGEYALRWTKTSSWPPMLPDVSRMKF